jgi:hypothetical protein
MLRRGRAGARLSRWVTPAAAHFRHVLGLGIKTLICVRYGARVASCASSPRPTASSSASTIAEYLYLAAPSPFADNVLFIVRAAQKLGRASAVVSAL